MTDLKKPTAQDLEVVAKLQKANTALTHELHKVIVGQDEVIEQLLICLFAEGHAILEGVPGLAKTLLVSSVAETLDLEFRRIQFTPDLMPADITGTEVIQENKTTGARELAFMKGPVFTNLLLADEINRTPPKTQAALLEAMQERQVSVAGRRNPLPSPFFVLATQNPIEQEGTYPLPEAQQDRFMFKIFVGYPKYDEEFEIIRSTTTRRPTALSGVLTGADVLALRDLVRRVPVADHVIHYALALTRQTRVHEKGDEVPQFVRDFLAWGCGPRAGQYLILGAKARAILHGEVYASTDDVAAVAKPVLRHRLVTNFNAESEGVTVDDIVDRIIAETPAKEAAYAGDQALKTALKV